MEKSYYTPSHREVFGLRDPISYFGEQQEQEERLPGTNKNLSSSRVTKPPTIEKRITKATKNTQKQMLTV